MYINEQQVELVVFSKQSVQLMKTRERRDLVMWESVWCSTPHIHLLILRGLKATCGCLGCGVAINRNKGTC